MLLSITYYMYIVILSSRDVNNFFKIFLQPHLLSVSVFSVTYYRYIVIRSRWIVNRIFEIFSKPVLPAIIKVSRSVNRIDDACCSLCRIHLCMQKDEP